VGIGDFFSLSEDNILQLENILRDSRYEQIHALAAQLTNAGLNMHAAQRRAIAIMYNTLQAQATALSYVEVYRVLAVGSASMILLSFMLRRNELGKSENISVQ
jgi:hypothetical protein